MCQPFGLRTHREHKPEFWEVILQLCDRGPELFILINFNLNSHIRLAATILTSTEPGEYVDLESGDKSEPLEAHPHKLPWS